MADTDHSPAARAAQAAAAGIDLAAERAVTADRLNWLRAGVLGANDGIVSTAALILGVAGASLTFDALFTAGVAALVSGALSMAAGEYVSVSAQRDTEKAAVVSERTMLAKFPEAELEELVALLRERGLSAEIARAAARELTQHNALAAHADIELGIELGKYTDPLHAALASALSFAIGALVPLAVVLLSPLTMAVPVTVLAVLIALTVTGVIAAQVGGAPWAPSIRRNVIGGGFAMAVTYGIGRLVGAYL
ncbi:MAG: VIT family protein [Burkholderiales bacterium]|nr:VIT family protein [Burkholderiales bacterium]